MKNGNITVRTRKKASLKDKSFLRSLLAGFAALMVVVIVVPLVAFFTAYAVTKVPEPEELVNNQVSHIMAMDGKSELARIVPPEGNRQNVKLKKFHFQSGKLCWQQKTATTTRTQVFPSVVSGALP